VKPEEPESITGKIGEANDSSREATPTRESLESKIRLPRPDPAKTPLTRMKPTVAVSLAQANQSLEIRNGQSEASVAIEVGESCKNGGCKETYQGEPSKPNECVHHPGVPVFHEGLKYWSCCQRKTTDFQSFLNQAGCNFATHKWKKSSEGSNQVECRYDWHQTASHVVVAIYAKKYDPDSSYVDISSVRLKCHIVFPEQGGSFDMDIELRGIISVGEASASFLGTKVEIKMKKAEPGSWAKLEVLKAAPVIKEELKEQKVEDITDEVDDLDLDDLDALPTKLTLSKEASGGRTDHEII